MSHTVNESTFPKSRAQEPRLIVDRYGTMDMVTINFILPPDVLTKGARGRDIAVEVQAYIVENGLGHGHVEHYHPISPGTFDGSGPYTPHGGGSYAQ